MDFLSILPNLSIGVVAIVGLVYVTIKHSESSKHQRADFLKALDNRTDRHEKAMSERENALREVEKEVRNEISAHLTVSTSVIQEASKVMERVINHLDSK